MSQPGFRKSRMTRLGVASVVALLFFSALPLLQAKDHEHQWTIGKILDGNGILPYAAILSKPAPVEASAGGAITPATGDASRPAASTLIVEGTDLIYVTAEPIQWRWSKGVNIPLSGAIEYYVEGNTLHLLDQAGKEHAIQILRLIRRIRSTEMVAAAVAPAPAQPAAAQTVVVQTAAPPPAVMQTAAPQPAAQQPAAPPTPIAVTAEVHPVPSASDAAWEIRKAAATAAIAAMPAMQRSAAVTAPANAVPATPQVTIASTPAPQPLVTQVATVAPTTPAAVYQPVAAAPVAVAKPVATVAAVAPAPAVQPTAAAPAAIAPVAETRPVAAVAVPAPAAPKPLPAAPPPAPAPPQVNLPETPAAPPPAFAPSINVDSTPSGATVEIDHEPAGTTPLVHALSKGFHDITVSKDGFLSWNKTVVMSETDLHLRADLEQAGPSQ